MKVGDKIVCILDTTTINRITYGKKYVITSCSHQNSWIENGTIIVLDDNKENFEVSYSIRKHIFMSLEQWREQQLNQIL